MVMTYLSLKHMLLGLGSVRLRPNRAGAHAFCAGERASARIGAQVSERVSARVHG